MRTTATLVTLATVLALAACGKKTPKAPATTPPAADTTGGAALNTGATGANTTAAGSVTTVPHAAAAAAADPNAAAAAAAAAQATVAPTVAPTATIAPVEISCKTLTGNWYLDNGFGTNLIRQEWKVDRMCVHALDNSESDRIDIDGCEINNGSLHVRLDRRELGLCVIKVTQTGSELSYLIGCGTAAFPKEPHAGTRYVKR